MRKIFFVPVVLSAVYGCSSPDSVPPGGGGGSNAGGAAQGGGIGTSGGVGTGAGTGGTNTTGGFVGTTGGSSTGGTATGGSSTGGAGPTGGVPGAGNTSTGGVSMGGAAGASTGGLPGTGGGAGKSSTGGASTGGAATTGGAAGAATTGGSGGIVGGVDWPNDMSKANSDTWLVTNHDKIVTLRPKVLVINLESTADAQATTLVNKHIAALKEASSFHKYKDPAAQPAVVYELVKIAKATKGSRIDYNSWNSQSFADSNLQLKDPADPSGPNLTLCQLFEKGVINEVWCMASSDPKCGETQEAKQIYDSSGNKLAGRFASASNGDDITGLKCKVTARITDFNSGRGTGCHQHAMGHAWERYMDSNAVPMLGKQAKRFLNWDLNTRVGAPWNSFYSACNSNGAQLTDCMVWQSNIHVKSGASANQPGFDIADMSQGCGNAHFYPNTTGTYSYDARTPDPEVLAACENYGLHNGTGGKDLTTPFTNAMTDKLYGNSSGNCPADKPACDDDCGGHGTTYLYQNFPGPGTKSTNDDGTPMKNWWVYLFY